MDAVYILGSGSLADNKEVFFSVRSLAQNMLDLRDVYIVGEDPKNLPRVIHIPASDETKDKWRNAFSKTKIACSIKNLSADFLLMNDDFFMLEPFMGEDWPFYALKNGNGGTCGPVDFSIHCPIRLNKEMYLSMPMSGLEKGHLSPRTFYANFYKAPPKYTSDFTIRVNKFSIPIEEQIEGKPCFSISDGAMIDKGFLNFLQEKYSVPSQFEH